MATSAIILAAGAGTRMKSKKSKVAHEIMGKPLVKWVVDTAKAAGVEDIVTVVGHAREQVIPLVEGTRIAVQEVQNGTAGAVLACAEALEGFEGSLVVLSGDCPLIKAETIKKLVALREEEDAAVVVLTMIEENPFGYGRIIRDVNGHVERIVEQKDATPEEAAVTECNSGFYCFDAKALFSALTSVNTNNAQGELYLTDVLAISREAGRKVLGLVADDPAECMGINSRAQLADATAQMQKRINDELLAAGVTMWDPAQVWVGPDVKVSRDVELLPQVILLGTTTVEEDCVIGPNVCLVDATVTSGSIVRASNIN